MAEQLTFSLGIKTTADVSGLNKLKKELKELESYGTDADFLASSGLTPKQINQSVDAVKTLHTALDKSFDVRLNGINFNKFQKELQSSGMSLGYIRTQMGALGTQGEASFAKASAQIFKMNTALKTSNGVVDKLFSTFTNTVQYTAFNAILNTISKTVSNAIGYVKDLDESLNNIRIVSSQSAEQMSKFAEEANKAAKALGSSTVAYTDAALVFYQQGLQGEEVTDRADVVTKMANVTGDSAQKVSQDLTAVWNNFYDGSKSLEYYADVMTALGAATASSTDEISEGLEKFAAVASTTGLSYEYATAALATVTAKTRESADVVGTAFKTLFARIQGLSLGETLEDGTDLNKYSKALASVGINIKGQNGQLKEMDKILDELGSKWDTLNKDSQVALAQTVGGMRQYNQLIALMDNWDFMKENLQTVSDATGELNRQQFIYMESTQAHIKNLKATSEDLYNSLFDSNSLNDIYDGFSKLISGTDELVEALGGLKNILPIVLTSLLKMSSVKIATGISNRIINNRNQQNAKADDMGKQQFLAANKDIFKGTSVENSTNPQVTAELEKQYQFTADIYKYRDLMTQEEAEEFNNLLKIKGELVAQTTELEEEKKILNETNNIFGIKLGGDNSENIQKITQSIQALNKATEEYNTAIGQAVTKAGEARSQAYKNNANSDVYANINGIEEAEMLEATEKLAIDLEKAGINARLVEKALIKVKVEGKDLNTDELVADLNEDAESLKHILGLITDLDRNLEIANAPAGQLKENLSLRDNINNITQLVSGVGQLAMSIQTIKNLGNIWSDEDLTAGEKLLQTVINLSMVLPMMITGITQVNDNLKKINIIGSIKGELEALKAQKAERLALEQKIAQEEIALEENKNKLQVLLRNKTDNDIILSERRRYLEEQQLRLKDLAEQKAAAETAIAIEEVKEATKARNKAKRKVKEIENQLTNVTGEEQVILTRKLTEANINLAATEDTLAKAKERKKAVMAGEVSAYTTEDVVKQRDTVATAENSLSTAVNTGSTIAHEIAETEDSIAVGVNTIEKDKNTVANMANTASQKGLIGTLKSAIAKVGEFVSANAALSAIVGVAAVAVAAYSITFEQESKALENSAESKKEYIEKTKEEINQLEDEQKELENLKTSYEDLYKQLKEYTISNQELAQQAYDLAIQYGDEELAIEALTGSYDDYTEAILRNQKAKNEELKNKYLDVANSSKSAISDSAMSKAGWMARDSAGYDLGNSASNAFTDNFLWTQGISNNEKFANNLNSFAGETVIDDSGHLDIDKLVDLYGTKQEDLMNLIRNDTSGFAQKVLKLINEEKENFDNYAQNLDNALETDLKAIELGLDTEGKSFIELQDELIAAYQGIDKTLSPEDAKKRAREYLNAINDELIKKESQSVTIAEAIAPSDAEVEEYAKKIGKMSDAEREYLASNIEIFKNSKVNLDEALEQGIEQINSNKKRNNISNITVGLAAATKNGKFTDEDIEKLFEDPEYTISLRIDEKSKGIEIDKDTFKQLDYGTQSVLSLQSKFEDINALRERNLELEGLIEKKTEEITNAASRSAMTEEEASKKANEKVYGEGGIKDIKLSDLAFDALETGWLNPDVDLDSVKNSIEALLQDDERQLGDMQEAFIASIASANNENITEYIDITTNTLTDKGKKVISGYKEEFIKDYEEIYDIFKNQAPDLSGLEAELKSLQNELEANSLSIDDWRAKLVEAKAAITSINSDIDSLQNVYKTLTDAVSEYNNNGSLTVDTIQSLISLDSAYLASLTMENNQLSFNNQILAEKFEQKKQELRLAATQQFLAEVGIIQTEQETEANKQAVESEMYHQESLIALGKAAEGSAEGFHKLVASMEGLDGVKVDDDAYKKAEKAYQNRLKMINKMTFSGLGSSSSSKSSNSKTKFDDEVDRYWEINKAIEKVTHSIEELNKVQDKLYGKQLMDSLEEENKLLEEQANRYKDLIAEQRLEAQELQGILKTYGMQFSEEGAITNYKVQYQKMIDEMEAATNAKNSGKMSDEKYDAAKENYDKFKKALDRYDKLYYDEIVKAQDQIADINRQILENNLQSFETDIEVNLNLEEAKRDWEDFMSKVTTDFKKVYKNFGAIFKSGIFKSKSFTNSFGIDMDAIRQVEAEIDKIMAGGNSELFSSLSEAQNKLKELKETMMEDAESVFDLYQEGWNNYLEAIDEIIDKFDKLNDKYDTISDKLNHEEKLTDLLYGDKAYDKKDEIYETQQKNLTSQMEFYNKQLEFYEKQLKKAKPGNEDALKFEEQILNLQDKLRSSEEEFTEISIKKYQNSIDKTFDELLTEAEKNKEDWEKQQALEDIYENDIEKVNDLAILQAKWNNLVNNTKGLETQKKLRDLMTSEMDELKSREKLTEYDIELMEKKMDVAQALADLEDSQNNKNSMKVTRGADGNWSYQYVADEDDVAEKQLAYLEAVREQYELTQAHIREVNEELLNNNISAIEELKQTYYEGYYNMEETSKKAEELSKYYWGENGLITQQLEVGQQAQRDFNIASIELVSESCASQLVEQAAWGEEVIALNDIITKDNLNKWEDCEKASSTFFTNVNKGYITLNGQLTEAGRKAGITLDNIFADFEGFTTNTDELFEALNGNLLERYEHIGLINSNSIDEMVKRWNGEDSESLKEQIHEAMKDSIEYMEEFWDDIHEGEAAAEDEFSNIEDALDKIDDEINDVNEDTEDVADQAAKALREYREYLNELEEAWNMVKSSIDEAINALEYYLSLEGKHNSGTSNNPLDGNGSNGASDNKENSNKENNKNKEIPRKKTTLKTEYDAASGQPGLWNKDANNGKGGFVAIGVGAIDAYYYKHKNEYKWDDAINCTDAFKTGGYTGEWTNGDKEGRIGLLHQKELVLNAKDTENVLDTVSIVRDLSSNIKNNLQSALAESITNALKELNISSIYGTSSNVSNNTNNVFNVNANFPSANDVNDIREALLGLPNLVNQYVSRKEK